jgi:tRNA U34 5-carboxymethylaminomethyl modifying GTPase MnmE/TrmE
MTVNQNDRRSRRLSVVTHATIALALACTLAACGKDQPAQDAAATSAATTAPAVTPETAVSAKVSALTVDQLREAARQALARETLDLAAEGLRAGHDALGEITGRVAPDDLLGHIFSSFCIGK